MSAKEFTGVKGYTKCNKCGRTIALTRQFITDNGFEYETENAKSGKAPVRWTGSIAAACKNRGPKPPVSIFLTFYCAIATARFSSLIQTTASALIATVAR